ncbi:MAG: LamG domain-containing protein, partial [Nanoarchaeota archaeon]
DNDTINYSVYINGTLNVTTAVNLSLWNASEGHYALNVSAWDGYNSSVNSSTIYFTLDMTPPTYLNFTNNASNVTKVHGRVNWTMNLSDNYGLSMYRFAHNESGNMTNGTLRRVSGTSANISTLQIITLERYICGQYWFNDSAGNVNQTNLSCFMAADSSAPGINFTGPTPVDGMLTSDTSFTVNVSIAESSLGNVVYEWNGTNYSHYDDSLILMYNFDNVSDLGENNTHAADLSRYENNGTINGTTRINVTGGKYLGGLELDGSRDYLNVPDSTIFDTGSQITASAWIKSDDANQTGIGVVLHDNSNYKWLLYFTGASTSDRVSFYIRTDIGGVKSASCSYADGAVADNQWHLLTGTYNQSLSSERIKMYYDGIECGVTDGYDEPISEGDEGVWVGRWSGNSFNGSIDEVRVWNRSLSAGEVYQQHISNLQRYNSTQWNLYANHNSLTDGTYIYQAYASDRNDNWNSTENRTITISTAVEANACGNNIKETGEECDGSDLGGESCASRGYGTGYLKCTSSCTFDTNDCYYRLTPMPATEVPSQPSMPTTPESVAPSKPSQEPAEPSSGELFSPISKGKGILEGLLDIIKDGLKGVKGKVILVFGLALAVILMGYYWFRKYKKPAKKRALYHKLNEVCIKSKKLSKVSHPKNFKNLKKVRLSKSVLESKNSKKLKKR